MAFISSRRCRPIRKCHCGMLYGNKWWIKLVPQSLFTHSMSQYSCFNCRCYISLFAIAVSVFYAGLFNDLFWMYGLFGFGVVWYLVCGCCILSRQRKNKAFFCVAAHEAKSKDRIESVYVRCTVQYYELVWVPLASVWKFYLASAYTQTWSGERFLLLVYFRRKIIVFSSSVFLLLLC